MKEPEKLNPRQFTPQGVLTQVEHVKNGKVVRTDHYKDGAVVKIEHHPWGKY